MLLITKNEKDYLLSRGLQWERDLHHSYSGAHKYYLTENEWSLAALNEYRKTKTLSGDQK